MFLCQSDIWPILCQLVVILAKLLDMEFKFILPSIYINFDIQTNFEVNQTQISHSISNNTPKTHQSGHISKPYFAQVSFTKKPTPPTFFNEFSETFRINANMDFAHTYHGRFFYLGLQIKFEPKIQKKPLYERFSYSFIIFLEFLANSNYSLGIDIVKMCICSAVLHAAAERCRRL